MLTIYNINKLNNKRIDVPLLVFYRIDTTEKEYIFNLYNPKMEKVEITLNREGIMHTAYKLWTKQHDGKYKQSIVFKENITTPDELLMAITRLLNN